MSSQGHENEAFQGEGAVPKSEAAPNGSVEPKQLEAGTLKLSGYTQDGMTRQSSIIKTQDFQGDESYSSESDDNFWTSTTCRVISLVILVIISALFVAWCVCMGGHCTSDGPCAMSCDDGNYGYTESDGPFCWSDCFLTCGGDSQSPIDFQSEAVDECSDIDQDLQLNNYDQPDDITLLNNGHTVQGNFHGNYSIEGLGFEGVFQAAQFHFHWGSVSSQGSEHTVDGREYPMELHIVHFDGDHPDFDEAIQHPGGVAVLGFFFRISASDNPAYNLIIDNLQQIIYKGQEVDIVGVTPDHLLPEEYPDFYRYDGSLTSPGCAEGVIWTVFTQQIPISEKQMAEFRKVLTGEEGEDSIPLVDNYRPPQPINSRSVQFCQQPSSGMPLY